MLKWQGSKKQQWLGNSNGNVAKAHVINKSVPNQP